MNDREQLITAHMDLAEKIAARKKSHVPPSVEYDELKSAAYMGLVEAARKYQDGAGTPFEVYAYPRIDGAVKDYLRERRWGSRTHHREVASLDVTNSDGDCLSDVVMDRRVALGAGVIDKAVSPLPTAVQAALKMYFVDDLTMKEIGSRLGVTESRVSQIVTKGKAELRSAWASREHELWSEVA